MINKIANKISENLDWGARALFMIIVALVVSNVILRFFGRPIHGAYEVVGLLMAAAIGLAISHCAAKEGHVAVTILVERMPEKYRLILDVVVNLCILAFLLLTVRMLVLYGNRLLIGDYVSMTRKIPMFYFAYIIAFGFVGYSLVLLGNLVESIKKVRRI